MIDISFTGTRKGMSPRQRMAFPILVGELVVRFGLDGFRFHDGDCIGSDIEARLMIIERYGSYGLLCTCIVHPPSDSKYRAFGPWGEIRLPAPYLERDNDILRESKLLIATPKEHPDELSDERGPMRGSGTWAVIRHARKMGLPRFIIWP